MYYNNLSTQQSSNSQPINPQAASTQSNSYYQSAQTAATTSPNVTLYYAPPQNASTANVTAPTTVQTNVFNTAAEGNNVTSQAYVAVIQPVQPTSYSATNYTKPSTTNQMNSSNVASSQPLTANKDIEVVTLDTNKAKPHPDYTPITVEDGGQEEMSEKEFDSATMGAAEEITTTEETASPSGDYGESGNGTGNRKESKDVKYVEVGIEASKENESAPQQNQSANTYPSLYQPQQPKQQQQQPQQPLQQYSSQTPYKPTYSMIKDTTPLLSSEVGTNQANTNTTYAYQQQPAATSSGYYAQPSNINQTQYYSQSQTNTQLGQQAPQYAETITADEGSGSAVLFSGQMEEYEVNETSSNTAYSPQYTKSSGYAPNNAYTQPQAQPTAETTDDEISGQTDEDVSQQTLTTKTGNTNNYQATNSAYSIYNTGAYTAKQQVQQPYVEKQRVYAQPATNYAQNMVQTAQVYAPYAQQTVTNRAAQSYYQQPIKISPSNATINADTKQAIITTENTSSQGLNNASLVQMFPQLFDDLNKTTTGQSNQPVVASVQGPTASTYSEPVPVDQTTKQPAQVPTTQVFTTSPVQNTSQKTEQKPNVTKNAQTSAQAVTNNKVVNYKSVENKLTEPVKEVKTVKPVLENKVNTTTKNKPSYEINMNTTDVSEYSVLSVKDAQSPPSTLIQPNVTSSKVNKYGGIHLTMGEDSMAESAHHKSQTPSGDKDGETETSGSAATSPVLDAGVYTKTKTQQDFDAPITEEDVDELGTTEKKSNQEEGSGGTNSSEIQVGFNFSNIETAENGNVIVVDNETMVKVEKMRDEDRPEDDEEVSGSGQEPLNNNRVLFQHDNGSTGDLLFTGENEGDLASLIGSGSGNPSGEGSGEPVPPYVNITIFPKGLKSGPGGANIKPTTYAFSSNSSNMIKAVGITIKTNDDESNDTFSSFDGKDSNSSKTEVNIKPQIEDMSKTVLGNVYNDASEEKEEESGSGEVTNSDKIKYSQLNNTTPVVNIPVQEEKKKDEDESGDEESEVQKQYFPSYSLANVTKGNAPSLPNLNISVAIDADNLNADEVQGQLMIKETSSVNILAPGDNMNQSVHYSTKTTVANLNQDGSGEFTSGTSDEDSEESGSGIEKSKIHNMLHTQANILPTSTAANGKSDLIHNYLSKNNSIHYQYSDTTVNGVDSDSNFAKTSKTSKEMKLLASHIFHDNEASGSGVVSGEGETTNLEYTLAPTFTEHKQQHPIMNLFASGAGTNAGNITHPSSYDAFANASKVQSAAQVKPNTAAQVNTNSYSKGDSRSYSGLGATFDEHSSGSAAATLSGEASGGLNSDEESEEDEDDREEDYDSGKKKSNNQKGAKYYSHKRGQHVLPARTEAGQKRGSFENSSAVPDEQLDGSPSNEDEIDVIDIIGDSSHRNHKKRNNTLPDEFIYKKYDIYNPALLDSDENEPSAVETYTNVLKERREHVAKASLRRIEPLSAMEDIQPSQVVYDKEEDTSSAMHSGSYQEPLAKGNIPNITWATFNGSQIMPVPIKQKDERQQSKESKESKNEKQSFTKHKSKKSHAKSIKKEKEKETEIDENATITWSTYNGSQIIPVSTSSKNNQKEIHKNTTVSEPPAAAVTTTASYAGKNEKDGSQVPNITWATFNGSQIIPVLLKKEGKNLIPAIQGNPDAVEASLSSKKSNTGQQGSLNNITWQTYNGSQIMPVALSPQQAKTSLNGPPDSSNKKLETNAEDKKKHKVNDEEEEKDESEDKKDESDKIPEYNIKAPNVTWVTYNGSQIIPVPLKKESKTKTKSNEEKEVKEEKEGEEDKETKEFDSSSTTDTANYASSETENYSDGFSLSGAAPNITWTSYNGSQIIPVPFNPKKSKSKEESKEKSKEKSKDDKQSFHSSDSNESSSDMSSTEKVDDKLGTHAPNITWTSFNGTQIIPIPLKSNKSEKHKSKSGKDKTKSISKKPSKKDTVQKVKTHKTKKHSKHAKKHHKKHSKKKMKISSSHSAHTKKRHDNKNNKKTKHRSIKKKHVRTKKKRKHDIQGTDNKHGHPMGGHRFGDAVYQSTHRISNHDFSNRFRHYGLHDDTQDNHDKDDPEGERYPNTSRYHSNKKSYIKHVMKPSMTELMAMNNRYNKGKGDDAGR